MHIEKLDLFDLNLQILLSAIFDLGYLRLRRQSKPVAASRFIDPNINNVASGNHGCVSGISVDCAARLRHIECPAFPFVGAAGSPLKKLLRNKTPPTKAPTKITANRMVPAESELCRSSVNTSGR